MQGTLLFKSEESGFEIKISNRLIVISGINENEFLHSYHLDRVINEINYNREPQIMYIFFACMILISITYEGYKLFVLGYAFSWKLFFVHLIIILLIAGTFWANGGFKGVMKFIKADENEIPVTREEYSEIVRILRYEFNKNV